MSHLKVSSIRICCREIFTVCQRLKVKFDKTSCFVYFSLPCTYQSRVSSRKLQNLIQSKLKGQEFVCHAIYDHLEGLRVLFIHLFIFSVTAVCLNTATRCVLCFCFIFVGFLCYSID